MAELSNQDIGRWAPALENKNCGKQHMGGCPGGCEPTNTDAELSQILSESPIEKEVPEDIWGTIHGTWTGLWTDAYGEWDEMQPSDIYPISELLSEEAEKRLVSAILAYTRRYHVVGLRELKEQTLELRDFQNESISICGLIQDVGAAIEKAIEAEEKKL